MHRYVVVAALAACSKSSAQDPRPLANAGGEPKAEPPAVVADRKNLLEDVDLVATYELKGDGLPDGTLSLKKIRGDAYRGTLDAGGKRYHVAAYRDGDLLALAWSDAKSTVGAAAMELYCDLALEAHYIDDDAGGAGKALVTGGNSGFTGTWTVEKGTIPGRDDWWTGRLDAKPSGDNIVTFTVSSDDNGTNKYLLIRRGDVLAGGYRYDKKPFVAANVRIGGGGATLEGLWVASTDAAPSAKPLHGKRQGGTAQTIALKPAGASKTPSGIACLDVPAGGHALFPKRAAQSNNSGGGGAACNGTMCNSGCVDLQSDQSNCGACGNNCTAARPLCHGGFCDCFENEKDNNGGVCP